MTGLLVSVRDALEARAALAGGADVIDIKEPTRGSLGAADVRVWRAVVDEVQGARPVSAALGELLLDDVVPLAREASGLAFAKIGLAGCAREPSWPRRLAQAFAQLPGKVAPVAAAYADYRIARAPSLTEVLDAAAEIGCQLVLLDTCDKTAGGLLDHVSYAELGSFVASARRRGQRVALAGSLDATTIPRVLNLSPDYIAVRGAVCSDGRTGSLRRALVKALGACVRAGGVRPVAASPNMRDS